MPPSTSSNAQNSSDYSFPRPFRLKRRRLIRALFDRERSDVFTKARGCIRILYRVASQDEIGRDVPVQIGFSVGRKIAGAVRRNKIKRLMREVYRVNQTDLIDLFLDRDDTLTMMILFRGNPDRAEEYLPNDLPLLLDEAYEHLSRHVLPED